mmetsp:Transcript_16014/g.47091  ORF Transcript_16014/g.47091 Transcript_16014/m.47091 type:complete len:277 (+) Transcript_16014:20-850(+)
MLLIAAVDRCAPDTVLPVAHAEVVATGPWVAILFVDRRAEHLQDGGDSVRGGGDVDWAVDVCLLDAAIVRAPQAREALEDRLVPHGLWADLDDGRPTAVTQVRGVRQAGPVLGDQDRTLVRLARLLAECQVCKVDDTELDCRRPRLRVEVSDEGVEIRQAPILMPIVRVGASTHKEQARLRGHQWFRSARARAQHRPRGDVDAPRELSPCLDREETASVEVPVEAPLGRAHAPRRRALEDGPVEIVGKRHVARRRVAAVVRRRPDDTDLHALLPTG